MKGFEYNIAAIPTKYAGVMFRSRLEARAASFFDLLGWKWAYEPFDLYGWTPDFRLELHEPVLVEVKPVYTESLAEVFEKLNHDLFRELEHRTWMLTPPSSTSTWDRTLRMGLLGGRGTNFRDDALIGACGGCNDSCETGLSPSSGVFDCWCCNAYSGNPANNDDQRIRRFWNEAGNITQTRYGTGLRQ